MRRWSPMRSTGRLIKTSAWFGALAAMAALGAAPQANGGSRTSATMAQDAVHRSQLGATMSARRARPGVVFGGFTPQGWPVAVEVSRDRRKVVRAAIGLDLKCTAGDFRSHGDFYTDVPLSKTGRFRASFSGSRTDYPDGTFDVFRGSMRGAMKVARTKMTGTWRLMVTAHAASGAVTDNCDSGTVKWRAKQ
jgi:hypothetical protein